MEEEKRYSVMISSSVNGFEDQLKRIEVEFKNLGYAVVLSMSGTMKVDPRLNNFDNCLKAVENCDLFFGVIRPDCGTGRMGEKSITFNEFMHARECHKPCWFVIDNKIKVYKELLKTLVLKEHPNMSDDEMNKAIAAYYDKKIRSREKLPKVLDVFGTKDLHKFDPLCFEMEDFVNHKGIPREEVVNNWMQYCNSELEIATFIHTNFSDISYIENILKEA